ncbi:hypothetical protein [Reichenbachiella sp. MALMAid0571]|uniref:hypothetical protein n=1 Tax=Reichenbachiella sp. MALMAid0571 TaxID=3143939 RepID=UPI0032DF8987
MNNLHIMSMIFFGIGILVIFLARFLKRKNEIWMLNASPVKGILKEIEASESETTYGRDENNTGKITNYYFHIEYTLDDTKHILRHYNGDTKLGYDIGDELDLRYNLDNHEDAKLYSWWTQKGFYGLLTIIGTVLLGVSFYTLYKASML